MCCILWGPHTYFKIKIRQFTYSYIVILSLELFCFSILYIVCDVCFEMLTGLIYIWWSFFPNVKKRLIIIIKILLPLTNNNTNRHQTHHAPSNFLFRSSINSLPSNYPLILFIPYIDARGTFTYRWVNIWLRSSENHMHFSETS